MEGGSDRAGEVLLSGLREDHATADSFHVKPRGLFGPSFLAMLLFEKFGAHQPLNRQRDRYDREGMDLSPPWPIRSAPVPLR